MTEHDAIRELLALAAAGALDSEQQMRVDRHARECEACRAELARWSGYAEGLRQLRQPALPERLLERTRARVLNERAAGAGRRKDAVLASALAAFTWIVGLTAWLLFQVFSGGADAVLELDLSRALKWSIGSTLFVWVTAAAAAIVLGRSRREQGAAHGSI
jgi:predicted anti-sigma-YlaC factor YlaD